MSVHSFRQTVFAQGSDESRDVLTALKTAKLGWTTRKVPLFTEEPDALGGIEEMPGAYAVKRSDTGAKFGPVGESFTCVDNQAGLIFIQPVLDAGHAELISAGYTQNGARVYIQAKLTNSDVEITRGDRLFMSVNFATAHDGSLNVGAGYSSTRVICQNTMMAMIMSLAFKARHTKNVHDQLEKAALEFHEHRASLQTDAERFRGFAKRKLDDKALVKYVRETLSEGAGSDPDIVVRGVDRIVELAHEAPGATPGTLWGGLNAVTYWASHERGRSENARQNALLFGDGSALIGRAVQVATQYAEHLPSNELGRASYANSATASAEFGSLLTRKSRLPNESRPV